MSLKYEVTNWENGKTVLKAEHLRKIEKGITDIMSENYAIYTDEDTRKSNEINRQNTFSNKVAEVNNKITEINNFKENMTNTVSNKIDEVETRFNTLTSKQQQDSEVIDARAGAVSLKARLDNFDSQLEQKANKKQIFVEDFGAKGDGKTDDYNAILSAINSNNTIIEFMSEKTYYFSKPLIFENLSNKIIEGNNATLLYKGEESTDQPNGGVFQFDVCNNIKIRNLSVNVNGGWIRRPYNYEESYNEYHSKRNKFKDAFYMNNSSNIIIENCYATKCRVGYFIVHSKNVRLNNNISYKTMADSFFITGACREVNVGNHYSELVNDDCNSICGFNDNNDNNPNNCHVHDNIAKDCFGTGATLQSARNCTIKNCISINNRDIPFKLGGQSGSQFSENCTIDGITVITNNIIQGNFESTVAKHCIMHLGKNKNCKLINSNIIRENTSQPFIENLIVGVEGISIENNNITGYEFVIASSNNINISNNTIFTNGNICINESSNIKFNNNQVTTSETYDGRGTSILSCNNSQDIELLKNTFNFSLFRPLSIFSDKGLGNISIDYDDVIEVPNTSNMPINIKSNGIISINSAFTGTGLQFANNQLVRNVTTGELFYNKNNSLIKII